MFKKFLIGTLVAVIVVAAGASAYTALAAPAPQVQSQPVAGSNPAEPVVVAESVAAPVTAADVALAAGTTVQTAADAAPAALTADDTAGLLYMYEEEKLARDVYNALYALWGQPTFQNIAASEQAHMDAVKVLLDRYGIADPGTAAGVFSNPALQALYDSLMATGSRSLADALKVGATIEEVDITDLNSRLALTTNADIQLVYSNLMNGSFSHLRNFVSALENQTGEVYQPQYLSADLYQAIVSGANGNSQGGSTGSTTGRGHGAGTATTGTTGGKGYRGGR